MGRRHPQGDQLRHRAPRQPRVVGQHGHRALRHHRGVYEDHQAAADPTHGRARPAGHQAEVSHTLASYVWSSGSIY